MPTVTFTDSAGVRHPDVELPASLLKPGVGRARQEAYLKQTGQIGNPAPMPSAPVEVVELVKSSADNAALEARVAALEAQPAAASPSEESLRQWARSAERVGLAHQELAAIQEATVQQCEAAGAAADQRLAELDSQQQALVQAVSESVSQGEEQISQAVAAFQQSGADAIADIDSRALAKATSTARKAAELTAKEEAVRWAGAGTTIVDQDPLQTDPQSIGQMAFGRSLVAGDCVLHPGPDSLRFFRWNGDAWDARAGELVNKVEVRDVKVSALDNSTKTTNNISNPTTTIFKGGGSGGEGGLPLLRSDVITSWQPIAIGYSRGDLPLPTDPGELKAARHQFLGDIRGVHFHLLIINNATLDSNFVSGTIFLDATGLENICYYDDRSTNHGDDFELEVTLVRIADLPVAATDYFPGGTSGRWEFRARIVEHTATAGIFGLSGRIVPLREMP